MEVGGLGGRAVAPVSGGVGQGGGLEMELLGLRTPPRHEAVRANN